MFVVLLGLVACKDDEPAGSGQLVPTDEIIQLASEILPKDAALAEKYLRSCQMCHASPDAEAPLTGHVAAWNTRLDQHGMGVLVLHVKTGVNAMPPMGLCNDCSDDEFIALIEFMSGKDL